MDSTTSSTTVSSAGAATERTLLGAIVRSAIPRGRIKRVELAADHDWSRVVVVRAQDVPGRTSASPSDLAPDVLAGREVHYTGEPVLLVAAEDAEALAAAVGAIEIEYQAWMPVCDLEESIEAKTRIRMPANVICEVSVGAELDIGDGAVGTQFFMESREQWVGCGAGARAVWRDDGALVVSVAAADPAAVADAVAAVVGLDRDAVVVHDGAGSSFASCPDRERALACHVALLARAARRPVAIAGERHVGPGTAARFPGEAQIRSACTDDGAIDALSFDLVLDGGAHAPDAAASLRDALDRVTSVYRLGRVHARGRVMATNTPPRSPALGGGAPQATLALERHLDRVARRLGVEAHELRLRRLAPGEDTALRERVLRRAIAETDYVRKHERARGASRTSCAGIGLAVAGRGRSRSGTSFACAVAEVDVDVVTLEIKMSSLSVFRDRPSSTRNRTVSAIERAAARALGFGVQRDDVSPDDWSPDALVRGIPTASDLDRIELFTEERRPRGGPAANDLDLAADAVEPALAAAVEHALGVDVDLVPLTPESLVQAVERVRRESLG